MVSFSESLKARGLLTLSQSLKDGSARRARKVRGDATIVVDGPFAEAKEMIGGFFLLTCETREQAIAIAAQCPVASRPPSRCANSARASNEALEASRPPWSSPTSKAPSRRSGAWNRPKIIAKLARMLRDVGLAEELAQDALVTALEQWPESGVPDNPGAWLMATAKNRALDQLRRIKLLQRKHQIIATRRRSIRADDARRRTRRPTRMSATICCG